MGGSFVDSDEVSYNIIAHSVGSVFSLRLRLKFYSVEELVETSPKHSSSL